MGTPARYYSSTAVTTTLSLSISSTDVAIQVASSSGFPSSYPFTLILAKDSANEEILTVTALVGSQFTVTRGVDGTSARSHTAGTSVEHGVSALDFTDQRSHQAAGSNVHDIGASSSVVGTNTTQTLTNKTLTSTTLGGDLAAGSNKITDLADPTLAQDAVTKNWAETGMSSQLAQATTQATNAATSATAAAASAAAALVSEGNASASETATAADVVSTNADAASTAADVVTTNANVVSSAASAAAALASETASATSETNAATSATNAATSETNAAASSVSAANSAAAAASSLDSFDDRYLGQKASAPSVDNDGDALVTGALYYDTTAQEMRVYDGAGWLAASAASVVSLVTFEYTASAAQTVFTGADNNGVTLAYSVGLQQVFLNGVLLAPGDDYTTTDSGTITLASGAALNDYLIVCAFSSFEVANTYTQTQADALFLTQTSASTTYATKTELTSVEALALLGL